jgi:transposase
MASAPVVLCRLHGDQIKLHDHAIAGLDEQIAGGAGRWLRELGLLKSVPGFGDVVSAAWLAEIGPAPHRWFPSHDKLACWVTLCPGNNISARKRKSSRTGDAGPTSSRCWSRRPGPRSGSGAGSRPGTAA